ncbi:nuclear pore complex protein Nup214-like [Ctenocephalides felis]|uniref:nuclear pore complex protein Nup214-like n=1 Tax=Ctenocephalides felis TaxID=7515 RepID=UPI000E6E163D|nr:nuclear pore complex protein Nup214-like [Ctenocephalides felis]XP_026462008.1 nuclear pore complex protein Nup214-like [Ctenocephalides felis]
MSVNAPNPKEVQDFKFILHSKVKIFEKCETPCNNTSLLCAASRFGLIFTACQNIVKVVQLSALVQNSPKDKNVAVRKQELPGHVTYLAVNCDHTVLSIVLTSNGNFILQFYDVTSYYKQTIVLVSEVRLPSPLLQMSWNPCIANVVAATLENGTLWSCEFGNGPKINSTENDVQALSLSWSPKGKQIVIGTKSGTLCQFKPDLKPVKTISVSDMKGSIISVQWLSNDQFAATFLDSSDPKNPPNVVIINASKSGQIYSINYDEVCYSSRNCTPKSIYFIHQQSWSLLFVLSVNSIEVGLLAGIIAQDVCNWEQWFLADDARAELPLVGRYESFMCGYALDTGSTKQITIGNNKTLQPMPMLHLLTDHGFLISFDALNLKNDAPCICSPPEPIKDGSGLSSFIIESSTETPNANTQTATQATAVTSPSKNENLFTSSVPNQELKPNMTVHSSEDFSFMINNPAITSTPAKSINTLNQEHKEKLALSLSVKANLVMDKTIGSKPPIESKQSLTTQTLCSKTDDHAFNFTATSQNQLKIEKCTTLQPINQTAGSTQDAVSSLEKKSDELENSNVDEDSEEIDEEFLNLLQLEAFHCVEELQDLLLYFRNIDN